MCAVYQFSFSAQIQYTVEKSKRTTLIIFEKSKRLEIYAAPESYTCRTRTHTHYYYFSVVYWFTYLPGHVLPRHGYIELSQHSHAHEGTKLQFYRFTSSSFSSFSAPSSHFLRGPS